MCRNRDTRSLTETEPLYTCQTLRYTLSTSPKPEQKLQYDDHPATISSSSSAPFRAIAKSEACTRGDDCLPVLGSVVASRLRGRLSLSSVQNRTGSVLTWHQVPPPVISSEISTDELLTGATADVEIRGRGLMSMPGWRDASGWVFNRAPVMAAVNGLSGTMT